MSTGDYLHWQFQYTRKVADVNFAAADTSKADVLAVKTANHRVFVQRIQVNVITDGVTQLIFQDDAGTPVIIARTKTSPGLGPITFDFGPVGTPLTLGTNLDIASSGGAALAARIHIEGYEKLDAAIAHTSGASLQ